MGKVDFCNTKLKEMDISLIKEDKKQALLATIQDSFNKWLQTLAAFKDEQFNVIPFEGSWTPAQVADHILKATAGIPDQHTQLTARPFDEKAELLANIFLNFSTKMKSPNFVLPDDEPKDKQHMLAAFKQRQSQLRHQAETLDLSLTCLDFEFPTIGFLTRYEWLNFFVVHVQRHTWQLQKMLDVFNLKS